MSQAERTGKRSLIYSTWHRVARIRRYLSLRDAAKLDMIDIDSCEVCCYCKEPVALIETQESTKPPKPAPFMAKLAKLADIPAYSVSCEPDTDGLDIVSFKVRRVQPPDPQVHTMLPNVYAYWLLSLRDQHIRTSQCGTGSPVPPHNSCDCEDHMGFHIDCDENGVPCHCQPKAVA